MGVSIRIVTSVNLSGMPLALILGMLFVHLKEKRDAKSPVHRQYKHAKRPETADTGNNIIRSRFFESV